MKNLKKVPKEAKRAISKAKKKRMAVTIRSVKTNIFKHFKNFSDMPEFLQKLNKAVEPYVALIKISTNTLISLIGEIIKD